MGIYYQIVQIITLQVYSNKQRLVTWTDLETGGINTYILVGNLIGRYFRCSREFRKKGDITVTLQVDESKSRAIDMTLRQPET